MVGKLFRINKNKFFILFLALSVLFLFYLFKTSSENGKTVKKIKFEIVEQDYTSKYKLVDLSYADKKILATFDRFNPSFGKVLHKNDFWSPTSCAAMPNLFLGGNFLTVLDVEKNKENNKVSTNIFVYDYNNNFLKKSEDIPFLVGNIYTVDKKNMIFFTYNNQKLTMNFFDPSSFTVIDSIFFSFKEKSPSFRFYEIDKKIYIKIISDGNISNYFINNKRLEKIKAIPNRDFWNVLNEKNKASISKDLILIELPKKDFESYKTLKVSDNYIVFSRMNLSTISKFTLEVLDIKTRKITPIYSNDGIENNYYLINVD